jgi:hypothetical protein
MDFMNLRTAATVLALALALPAAAAAPPAAARPNPDLGPVRLQFWYEETGRLSRPVDPARFAVWNSIIGEGDAEEIANDLFVTVEVLTGGEEANVDVPLVLEARNGKGRVIATRTVKTVLTSGQGRAVKGLWLYDVGCAGPLTVTARLGKIRRETKIKMVCGE